jgi:AraC family transcriptional regulator
MTFEPSDGGSAGFASATVSLDASARSSRIELIVDGERRPVCASNRVLLESGRFWSGYRLELLRIPAAGCLERVSTPNHRIVFVASGTCDVRYRADGYDARHRLSPASFCFISRGYLFQRLCWKANRFEAFIVDITDLDARPSPIDAFGRTDALFDMYMGLEDARVATLIDLMRAEIKAGCPTGSAYGEALSVALSARVASLCASMPGERRHAAVLSAKQLAHVTNHVAKHLSDELTIDRLAALVNMSPFHFARCFKQTTGFTPHQFVIRERIARARALLSSGTQSIGDVAMALGFASQSHFADVYRRVTGTTPRSTRSR